MDGRYYAMPILIQDDSSVKAVTCTKWLNVLWSAFCWDQRLLVPRGDELRAAVVLHKVHGIHCISRLIALDITLLEGSVFSSSACHTDLPSWQWGEICNTHSKERQHFVEPPLDLSFWIFICCSGSDPKLFSPLLSCCQLTEKASDLNKCVGVFLFFFFSLITFPSFSCL